MKFIYHLIDWLRFDCTIWAELVNDLLSMVWVKNSFIELFDFGRIARCHKETIGRHVYGDTGQKRKSITQRCQLFIAVKQKINWKFREEIFFQKTIS